ncbi:MAG: NTP transferase domain-containing protein [Candidatus Omnitrophica bacterium]|nr:NTP transferase domain-containing protein [Candidatus Omnitrophota bacterium]
MRNIVGIILAGGKGSRYKFGQYKFLSEYKGKFLLVRIIEEMLPNVQRIAIVTPPENSEIKNILKDYPDIEYVIQKKPLGTGHALLSTDFLFENTRATLLVSYADKPLITAKTFKNLIDQHIQNSADITIATAILPFPGSKGRIIRVNGKFAGVVEVKDATEEILKIKEVNAGFIVCESETVYKELRKIKNNNAAGEYYLTDVYTEYLKDGLKIHTVKIPPEESCDINTVEELTRIEEWINLVKDHSQKQ